MPGKVVSREEWQAARSTLLSKEVEHTRVADAIRAERQALPMVLVDRTYTFQGPEGPVTLKELFGTKSQLIVYHYMFEPTAEEGCQGCAFMVSNFPDIRQLAQKDTALVVISRASIDKITPFKAKNAWNVPWVSSHDSTFNYDFHATIKENPTLDDSNQARRDAGAEENFGPSEQPGFSVFKLEDGNVYQTYSAFHRLESLAGTYVYLDLTQAGRQEGLYGPAEFKTPSEYQEDGQAITA